MRKYSNLVNKNFKVNRRRNLLTVLGIIFSMILLISTGYINRYIKDINIANAKYENGDYEAIVFNVDVKNIDKITNNVKVSQYGYCKLENSAKINIGDVEKKLEITALDSNSRDVIFKDNINITEGRLPIKEEELALTNLAKSELNKNIGDTIAIGYKKYTIVGFYEDKSTDYFHKLTGISYLNSEKINSNLNVVFSLSSKNNKIDNIIEIGKLLGKEYRADYNESEVQINKRLFYAYGIDTYGVNGYLNQEKLTTFATAGIIALLTIIFIYSSINISFKERIQQFSTLRCMGATSSKIRIMLMKESALLATYSILPGILSGLLLSWTITNIIFTKIIGINNYGIPFTMYYEIIIIATIITLGNIFIATILPVIRVKNITPIEGLRHGAVSSYKIKIRKSKIIKKLFGYKGELAYKNIASNSKSFFIITTTLTSLLIVFVVFSGFYIYTTYTYNNDLVKSFDISGAISSKYTENIQERRLQKLIDKRELIKEKLIKSNLSNESFTNIQINIKIDMRGFNINPKLTPRDSLYSDLSVDGDGTIMVSGLMLIYDDESLSKILPYIDTSSSLEEQVTLDKFKENGFIVVNSGYATSKPPLIAKEKEITMVVNDSSKKPIDANYLGSIYHRDLIAGDRFGYYNYFTIIVSSDFYNNNKEIIDNNEFNSGSGLNINLNYNKDNEGSFSKVKEIISENGGYYLEPKKSIEYYQNNLKAMSVFIYTVLFLTMAIGGLNIINTRTINIILRKKEFGTLLAIGMKSKDVKKLIILEGIVQWFISSIIGVIISVILIKAINIMMFYSSSTEMYGIPKGVILFGVVLILVVNLLSSLIPYKKLKGLEVNELLRNDE